MRVKIAGPNINVEADAPDSMSRLLHGYFERRPVSNGVIHYQQPQDHMVTVGSVTYAAGWACAEDVRQAIAGSALDKAAATG